jgi:hypothetical protein
MSVKAAQGGFFDRLSVVHATDRATRNVFSKFGAYVRRDARKSIRSGKKTSKPGMPPRNRTGTLKRFLYFSFDKTRKSVVIGPAKTNQVFFSGDGKPVKGTVPSVLEYGGKISILEVQRSNGLWWRADLRSRRRLADKPTRMRTVTVAARPFMGPAFAKNLETLPDLWRNAVRAA